MKNSVYGITIDPVQDIHWIDRYQLCHPRDCSTALCVPTYTFLNVQYALNDSLDLHAFAALCGCSRCITSLFMRHCANPAKLGGHELPPCLAHARLPPTKGHMKPIASTLRLVDKSRKRSARLLASHSSALHCAAFGQHQHYGRRNRPITFHGMLCTSVLILKQSANAS